MCRCLGWVSSFEWCPRSFEIAGGLGARSTDLGEGVCVCVCVCVRVLLLVLGAYLWVVSKCLILRIA